MSASSSSSAGKFYVFLSFRGQETRRTFLSHLCHSLDRRGIATLEDENESDPSVVDRTIGESKVAVALISESYASSPWCLESLVKILGFHNSGSLALIPIFYDIDPSDVRKQSGKLGEPFSLHERENPANVQTWRQTLAHLADIPSCQYSKNWEGDAEMIGKITNDIWGIMMGFKSSDLCGLVGMDRHMKAMSRFLDLGLKDEVRVITIWGREGIGKTEFANYLYEEVLHHFDTHVWLNVPKEKGDGFKVGEELHSKLQRYIDRDHRPCGLVVVNNVTNWDQIYFLEADTDLLGPGSRVIITTPLNQSFPKFQGYLRYEFVGLEFPDALQLFCLHAFEQTHPFLGFEKLMCRAVKLTGASPPTIKALGSSLFGRDKEEWEVLLSLYERSSHNGIIHPDKIIFDSFVTDSVSTQSSTINYSKDTVGMNTRMEAMLGLLELESDKEVRVVGIWGTGGIGKTTLARYAYEEISLEFHTHVFLEGSEDRNSSFCLENRFLSKAIERESFVTRNSKDGSEVVKSKLPHEKVLLIVDGVDDSKTLKDVWKIATWFGPGSRVIVTTRDESILVANGVKHVYEFKHLRFDEALQLFYQFALKQKLPSDRVKQLSVRAVKIVGFLPLALKITGSMLYGTKEDQWETILQSFQDKQGEVEVSAT